VLLELLLPIRHRTALLTLPHVQANKLMELLVQLLVPPLLTRVVLHVHLELLLLMQITALPPPPLQRQPRQHRPVAVELHLRQQLVKIVPLPVQRLILCLLLVQLSLQ
jgi:hypothetical protein